MALHVRLQLQFPQVKVLILGIFLALLGLASIVMGIVAFTKRIWGHYVATGLWGGTMVFAAGTCAIIASQLKTPCSVKSYLVCSLFGIMTSFVMIVLSAGGLDYSSNFYNLSFYAHTKRHTATVLVHATTLVLSFLSFLGNIISLIVCLKYIVYDRHQPVCETKVKKSSGRTLRKNVCQSNSESRVPLTGCHRSSRRPSRSKKASTSNRRETSRGDRRGSDGSYHSHRHRRKHEQSASSRGNRRCNYHTARSAIEYENIANDNLLQHRQQVQSRECSENYQEDLLPTAFDEEELPPYEPPSERVDVLPPNIPPDNAQQWQNQQTENIKPPNTPPSLDPDVRALYLANHEFSDNLNSNQRSKSSTDKSRKIMEETQHRRSSDTAGSGNLSNYQFPVSTSSTSRPSNLPLTSTLSQTETYDNEYENINKLSINPPSVCRRDKVNMLQNFESPAFHLRLEPEGRQDTEVKEDSGKLYKDNMSLENVVDTSSGQDMKCLVSPNIGGNHTSVPSFSVSDHIDFVDTEINSKDLNVSPLMPLKFGSSASAFHPYEGRNPSKPSDKEPHNMTSMSNGFGGARPKYTTSIMPVKSYEVNSNVSQKMETQSSWKEFLLPSPVNKNTILSTDSKHSPIKDGSVITTGSENSFKKQTNTVEAKSKVVSQARPNPPIFIAPASFRSRSSVPTSSSGSARPITSLHPRYHQPFSSDLSMFSPPASTPDTSVPQTSVLSSVNNLHLVSDNVSVSHNRVAGEPSVPAQQRPSLIGGEDSDVQTDQCGEQQEQQPQQRRRQSPQDGPKQPPLFSLLL